MATPFAALLAPQPDARTALAEGETESPETATVEVAPATAEGAEATPTESPATRQRLVADSATNLNHDGTVVMPELPLKGAEAPASTVRPAGEAPATVSNQVPDSAAVAVGNAGPAVAEDLPVAVASPSPAVAEAPVASETPVEAPTTAKPVPGSLDTNTVPARVSGPSAAPPPPGRPPSRAEAAAPIAELHDPAGPVVSADDTAAEISETPDVPSVEPSDPPAPSPTRAPSAPTQPATATAAAPAPDAPTTAPASMSAAPTATGSTAASAAPNAPAGTAAPSPSAALGETIRLAASQNFTRARLTLRPAELGGVEVLIATRGDGLAASLVAETAEAARLLESAGAELRRRLETHGLELHALYVSVAEDGPAGSGERRGEEAPAGTPRGGSGSARGSESSTQPTRTIELGGGVLIDVLA